MPAPLSTASAARFLECGATAPLWFAYQEAGGMVKGAGGRVVRSRTKAVLRTALQKSGDVRFTALQKSGDVRFDRCTVLQKSGDAGFNRHGSAALHRVRRTVFGVRRDSAALVRARSSGRDAQENPRRPCERMRWYDGASHRTPKLRATHGSIAHATQLLECGATYRQRSASSGRPHAS